MQEVRVGGLGQPSGEGSWRSSMLVTSWVRALWVRWLGGRFERMWCWVGRSGDLLDCPLILVFFLRIVSVIIVLLVLTSTSSQHRNEEIRTILQQHFFERELDVTPGHDVSCRPIPIDRLRTVDSQDLDAGDELEEQACQARGG